jgi:hypothetical protein
MNTAGTFLVDCDREFFRSHDVPDPEVLWGRLVHHLLVYEWVTLTDAALVTNPGLHTLWARDQLGPLMRESLVGVTVRDGKGIAEVFHGFTTDSPDPDLEEFRREIHQVEAAAVNTFVFEPRVVSGHFTSGVEAFIRTQLEEDHPGLIGASRAADIRAFEELVAFARQRRGDHGALLRRNFKVWDRGWHAEDSLPPGLRHTSLQLGNLVSAGVDAPYRDAVPTALGLAPWLPSRATSDAITGHTITSAQRLLERIATGATPWDLKMLDAATGWILAPDAVVYRQLAHAVPSVAALLQLREKPGMSALRQELRAALVSEGPMGARRGRVIGKAMIEHLAAQVGVEATRPAMTRGSLSSDDTTLHLALRPGGSWDRVRAHLDNLGRTGVEMVEEAGGTAYKLFLGILRAVKLEAIADEVDPAELAAATLAELNAEREVLREDLGGVVERPSEAREPLPQLRAFGEVRGD